TSTGYIYDADGNLLLQKDPSSTTLYLGSEQITVDSAGTTTGIRYYTAPGGATIVRTGASTHYGFELDADQHGTNTLYLDSTAQTPTWRQFDPYGNPRGTTTNWPDNRTFLNKTTDTTTGLTNIGAREYDPTTGRFTSLDPLFEATSPQQLSGYTYAADNPVTGSDPTGLMYYDPGTGASGGTVATLEHQQKEIEASGGGVNGGSGCYYMLKDPCGGVNGGSRCYYMLKDPCGTTYSNSGATAHSGTAHKSNSGGITPVHKKKNRNADHGWWWHAAHATAGWAKDTFGTWDGWKNRVLPTAGFITCVVASAGVCVGAGVAAALTTFGIDGERTGSWEYANLAKNSGWALFGGVSAFKFARWGGATKEEALWGGAIARSSSRRIIKTTYRSPDGRVVIHGYTRAVDWAATRSNAATNTAFNFGFCGAGNYSTGKAVGSC
ncbi:RHS repeat-associated core domain-containing protein, partial [Streptomyces sp. TRM68367]|uniref:RHS repeat-associated core domain-containing protein n=1 Tax=Streptomyces sp. TRM68367 TaxID=2758415 RepID=UPI0019BD1C81